MHVCMRAQAVNILIAGLIANTLQWISSLWLGIVHGSSPVHDGTDGLQQQNSLFMRIIIISLDGSRRGSDPSYCL